MDNMALRKSIYFTDDLLNKMNDIARDNKIEKKNNDIDISGVIKFLINNYDDTSCQNTDKRIDELKVLSEHIHAVIPQLFMRTDFIYKNIISQLNNEDYYKIYKQSIKKSVEVCGQLQDVKYDEVYPAKDKRNMTTLPIEEYKNTWK